jgi:hypothetical protein
MEFIQLMPALEERAIFSRASMSHDALVEVSRLLLRHRPETILEIGSGLSTFLFCRYCSASPESKYFGVDQPGKSFDAIQARLEKSELHHASRVAADVRHGRFEPTSIRLPTSEYDLIHIGGSHIISAESIPAMESLLNSCSDSKTIFIVANTNHATHQEVVTRIRRRHGGWNYREYVVRDSLTGYQNRTTTAMVPRLLEPATGSGLPTISVGITTWLRYPERWEYLQQVVLSLRENLDVGGSAPCEMLIAAESEDAPYNGDLERFAKQFGIKVIYHVGSPQLAGNYNQLVATAVGDYLLCTEDDRPLVSRCDVGPYLAFMQENADKGFHLLRFSANTTLPSQWCSVNGALCELLSSAHWLMPYHPCIRSRALAALLGPNKSAGVETGGESDMNHRAKNLAKQGRLRVLMTPMASEFGNIAKVSSMTEKWRRHGKRE